MVARGVTAVAQRRGVKNGISVCETPGRGISSKKWLNAILFFSPGRGNRLSCTTLPHSRNQLTAGTGLRVCPTNGTAVLPTRTIRHDARRAYVVKKRKQASATLFRGVMISRTDVRSFFILYFFYPPADGVEK